MKTMTTTTHGPWRGLDFDPTRDLNRTAQLCPEGWLVVTWDADPLHRGLYAVEVHGLTPDMAAEYADELEELGCPEDYGDKSWPDGRMFIARATAVDLPEPETELELVGAPDGELAYADQLPAETEVNSAAEEPSLCCGIAAVGTIDRDALLEVLARGGPPDDETFKARVCAAGPRPARGSTADALALLSSIPGVVGAEIKEHALHLEVDEWTDPAEVRSVVIPHMPAGLPIEVSRRAGAR